MSRLVQYPSAPIHVLPTPAAPIRKPQACTASKYARHLTIHLLYFQNPTNCAATYLPDQLTKSLHPAPDTADVDNSGGDCLMWRQQLSCRILGLRSSAAPVTLHVLCNWRTGTPMLEVFPSWRSFFGLTTDVLMRVMKDGHVAAVTHVADSLRGRDYFAIHSRSCPARA